MNAARLLALPALALALAACGEAKPTRIDELRGTYRGVGIGSEPRSIARVFGEERLSGPNEGIAPRGDEFVEIGGPASFASPCRAASPTLRYEHVSFAFCNGRVYFVLVAVDGARTRRGVSIGDSLDEVRRAYPSARCGEAPAGESLFGGQEWYPYCAVRTADERWVWFGRDPIKSIALARVRMPA